MNRFALVMLLAGCSTQADDGDPVRPGGGGPPPVIRDTGTISGRVCVIADARDLGDCSMASAEGISVSAGGVTMSAEADGSFSIPVASGGLPPAIAITGGGVVPTQMALSPTSRDMSIPVLRADLFSRMMTANGVTLTPGTGSILGSVIRGGQPLAGVTVASTPSPAFGPFFDGSTPTSWTLNGTGARGVIWIPGIAAGPTNLTFSDLASSGETQVNGVQVINGGITILDSAILP